MKGIYESCVEPRQNDRMKVHKLNERFLQYVRLEEGRGFRYFEHGAALLLVAGSRLKLAPSYYTI